MTARAVNLESLAEHLWMLVPGLLMLYLGFDAGGYFAGTAGLAAAGLSVLLAVRALTGGPASRPGLAGAGWVALAGIAVYAALSLLSSLWSHSFARALLAFDLGVLYLLLTGISGFTSRPRTLVYGLLVATAAICSAGLLSRVLPHVFPTPASFHDARLSFPLGYRNALGMLAGIGVLLAAHVSSDRRSPASIRALAAALLPGLAATLLLTYSRGAIAVLVLGLVAYLIFAPRLSAVGTFLAAAPTVAVALKATYDAGRLSTSNPTDAAAVVQGHHVTVVLLGCTIAAGLLRLAIVLLAERQISEIRVSRVVWLASAGAVVLTAVILAISLDAGGWINREYTGFSRSLVTPAGTSERARLGSTSSNGRLALWRVAVRGFDARPVAGSGAGTYALLWEHNRPDTQSVQNAHSLYLETLAELGVLGAAALVAFLIGLLLSALRGVRAPDRAMSALALACLLAVGLHVAVDWDWQMPVVLIAPISLAIAAGTAAPRAGPRREAPSPARLRRGIAGVCCLALGVFPALVAISQAHLDASVRAYARQDCSTALSEARAADIGLAARPQPLEIMGYCQARDHQSALAIDTMRAAVDRDPNDWEFHYALAIARAESGLSPFSALRTAQRLDPLEPQIQAALSALRGGRRRAWRRIALRLSTSGA